MRVSSSLTSQRWVYSFGSFAYLPVELRLKNFALLTEHTLNYEKPSTYPKMKGSILKLAKGQHDSAPWNQCTQVNLVLAVSEKRQWEMSTV